MTQKEDRIAGTHLYIMQAQNGLIKVGRSRNVERRRKALMYASGMHIVLILEVENEGWREQSILRSLAAFRRRGEWVAGSLVGKAAVELAVGRDLAFPYMLRRMDREPEVISPAPVPSPEDDWMKAFDLPTSG